MNLALVALCAAAPYFYPSSLADSPVRPHVLPGLPSSWLEVAGSKYAPTSDDDDEFAKKSPAEVMAELRKDRGTLEAKGKTLEGKLAGFKKKMEDEDRKVVSAMGDDNEKLSQHLDDSLTKFKEKMETGAEKFKEKGEKIENAFEKSMEGSRDSDDEDEDSLLEKRPQSLLQYHELPGVAVMEDVKAGLDDIASHFADKKEQMQELAQEVATKEQQAQLHEKAWQAHASERMQHRAADFAEKLSAIPGEYKEAEESAAADSKDREENVLSAFKDGMQPFESEHDPAQLRKQS